MKKIVLVLLLAGMIVSIFSWVGCKINDEDSGELELANVTDLEILLMESFPLQAAVRATGYLPSPCYELQEDQTKVERKENIFTVEIFHLFHRDMTCVQVIVPYSIRIPLDILDLKAGTYDVFVNGKKTSFELQQDNSLPFSRDAH